MNRKIYHAEFTQELVTTVNLDYVVQQTCDTESILPWYFQGDMYGRKNDLPCKHEPTTLNQCQLLHAAWNEMLGEPSNAPLMTTPTACCIDSIVCENGLVVEVNWSEKGFVHNAISERFPYLPALKKLDLSKNDFQGDQIPASFMTISTLEILEMNDAGLSGRIPATISQLTNLRRLSLQSNGLADTVPVNLTQLPNLKYLDISLNMMSGRLPFLTGLEYLDASYNWFSGSFNNPIASPGYLQLETCILTIDSSMCIDETTDVMPAACPHLLPCSGVLPRCSTVQTDENVKYYYRIQHASVGTDNGKPCFAVPGEDWYLQEPIEACQGFLQRPYAFGNRNYGSWGDESMPRAIPCYANVIRTINEHVDCMNQPYLESVFFSDQNYNPHLPVSGFYSVCVCDIGQNCPFTGRIQECSTAVMDPFVQGGFEYGHENGKSCVANLALCDSSVTSGIEFNSPTTPYMPLKTSNDGPCFCEPGTAGCFEGITICTWFITEPWHYNERNFGTQVHSLSDTTVSCYANEIHQQPNVTCSSVTTDPDLVFFSKFNFHRWAPIARDTNETPCLCVIGVSCDFDVPFCDGNNLNDPFVQNGISYGLEDGHLCIDCQVSDWSAGVCTSNGTRTLRRTVSSACPHLPTSMEASCCHVTEWSGVCDKTSGMEYQTRTLTGTCIGVESEREVPCCQIGPWVPGQCEPTGTQRNTRSVSSLCVDEDDNQTVPCCYTGPWMDGDCDASTGMRRQTRTVEGSCTESSEQSIPCCIVGEWTPEGTCKMDGKQTEMRSLSGSCDGLTNTREVDCCYTSEWIGECNTTLGTQFQTRTKTTACGADVPTEDTVPCCLIGEWVAEGICGPSGMQTRTRTVNTLCSSSVVTQDEVPCCYVSPWTDGACNTTTGLLQRTRTISSACPISTETESSVPCCQIGEWEVGICEPGGTQTNRRTISPLCDSTIVTEETSTCCYISEWTSSEDCDLSTGLQTQTRTVSPSCSSTEITRQIPCCLAGPWIEQECLSTGRLTRTRTLSGLCEGVSAIEEMDCTFIPVIPPEPVPIPPGDATGDGEGEAPVEGSGDPPTDVGGGTGDPIGDTTAPPAGSTAPSPATSPVEPLRPLRDTTPEETDPNGILRPFLTAGSSPSGQAESSTNNTNLRNFMIFGTAATIVIIGLVTFGPSISAAALPMFGIPTHFSSGRGDGTDVLRFMNMGTQPEGDAQEALEAGRTQGPSTNEIEPIDIAQFKSILGNGMDPGSQPVVTKVGNEEHILLSLNAGLEALKQDKIGKEEV
jgi:hypothetical protein